MLWQRVVFRYPDSAHLSLALRLENEWLYVEAERLGLPNVQRFSAGSLLRDPQKGNTVWKTSGGDGGLDSSSSAKSGQRARLSQWGLKRRQENLQS